MTFHARFMKILIKEINMNHVLVDFLLRYGLLRGNQGFWVEQIAEGYLNIWY